MFAESRSTLRQQAHHYSAIAVGEYVVICSIHVRQRLVKDKVPVDAGARPELGRVLHPWLLDRWCFWMSGRLDSSRLGFGAWILRGRRNDGSAPSGVRGKDVEADEGMTGRWDERTESRQELKRRHDAVGLPAARGLDAVGDPSVRRDGESLEAQWRTGAVAQQSLTAFAVGRRDRNRGVDVEATLALGAAGRLASAVANATM